MSLPRLNVITPVIRPEYLRLIADQLREFTRFKVYWYIVYDRSLKEMGCDFNMLAGFNPGTVVVDHWFCQQTGESGNYHRNEALDKITDGWVIFLDDDTLLPFDYEEIAAGLIEQNGDLVKGYIFSQIDKDRNIRVATLSHPPKSFTVKVICDAVGHYLPPGEDACDTGQLLFDRQFIGSIKWKVLPHPDRSKKQADHLFYVDIVSGREGQVRWLNVVGSIHNALR